MSQIYIEHDFVLRNDNGVLVATNGTVSAVTGTTLQYIDGTGAARVLNTSIVPELTNLYFTTARAQASISGSAPISVASGVVSITQANSTTNGYLSSTDWNTFNSKQQLLNGTGFVKIIGTTISYDNSTYYLASNPSNYISLISLSASAPLSYNNTTGVFSISQSSASANGYLSSTDWNTFNSKQSALTFGNVTGSDFSITGGTGSVIGSGLGLSLAIVNSNTYATNTFLKFSVNSKGLVTAASIVGGADIISALGYTPEDVANKSTSTSLGTSNTLYPTQNAVKTYIDSAVAGAIILQGDWNASTNSPNISGTTTTGWAWRVSVDGATNLGGITDWKVGDLAVKSASGWLKIDNTHGVTSVFGRYGAIVATSGDYTTAQVTESGNLYYTDTRARASLSFVAGSGVYNSTTGVITIPTNNNQILNGSNFITLSSLSGGTGISYNNTTGVISSTITQYTDGLARAAISGGTGISYNSTTGVITNIITQYTDALARASISAGTGISYSSSTGIINSTITQYTDTLARLAISLTTIGSSGSATYSSSTGVFNIPTYTLAGLGGITASFLSATSPLSYNFSTGVFSIQAANTSQNGYLSSTDWNTFNSKQTALGFTPIPNTRNLTINGTTYDLSADRSWTIIAGVSSVFGRTGVVTAQKGDYSLTQLSDVTLTTPSTGQVLKYNGTGWINSSDSGLTSVGITTSAAALSITNTPLTSNGNIGVNFAGASTQYVAGDGSLITFPALTGYVPYTGATNDVDLGTHKLSLNSEQFASISAPSYSEGALWYDSTQKALAYYNDISGNVLHIGQEVQLKVHNNTGSTIAKGAPVYVTSTSSGSSSPNVALAKADTTTTSNVIGLANQAIPTGTDGYITLSGLLTGVSTGAFTVGDILYLSPYSAGQLMNTLPPTGYAIKVGVVSYSNSPNGTIYINQSNAYSTAGSIVGTIAISQGGTGATTAAGALSNLGGIGLTSLSASSPLSYNNTTGAFSISQSSTSTNGYLSSTDWNTFNNKQGALTLTTTGSSGVATLVGNTLNIPNYTETYLGTVTSVALSAPIGFSVSGSPITSNGTLALSFSTGYSLPTTSKQTNWDNAYTFTSSFPSQTGNSGKFLTTDGTTLSWATNPLGTVTSVAALTLGTTGTDLSSTVANSTTTPVITLNVPTASATNRGALSSADWTTFNSKEPAITAGTTAQYWRGDKSWQTLNTTAVAEGTNLYFTNARAQGAITLTTTGSSGSATYTGGTLNVPTYTLAGLGGQPQLNGTGFVKISGTTISYDNSTYYLASNPNSYIALTALSAGTGISYNNTTGVISSTITQYTDAMARAAVSFTAGSGAYNNTTGVFTIPTNTNQLTNGANYITLSSLSASAPISYNNSTGAFSISQANTSTNGYLSSTDWNTFNGKQSALTNPVTGTATSGQVSYFNGTSSISGSNNHFWDATNNRLGIGLTNPQRSLEVYSATADSHLRLSGAAPSVSMGDAITGAVYQAKFGLATAAGQYTVGTAAGDFVILSQTGNLILGTNTTSKMQVNYNGTVSIGNTNSTYNLDVTGTGRFSSDLTASTRLLLPNMSIGYWDGANNRIEGGSLRPLLITAYSQPIYIGQSGTANLTIGTNGTATFSSSVLIGTTTNTGEQLQVNLAAYIKQYVGFGTSSNDRYIGQGNQISGAFQSYDFTMSNFTSLGRIVITNAATGVYLANGATSWSSFSDERLKNINGTIDSAVKKLSTLRAVDYSWKSDVTQKHNLGLIAQDVEKVFPQVIDKSKSFDAKDTNEYLSVKYTELVPVLVKAIQELKAQNDNLQQQINDLINKQ